MLKGALLRTAAPGDAARVAYLCYLAGRSQVETSVYDLMIPGKHGATAQRLAVMERMLTATVRSWFHHQFYTVADIGGSAVASLCAFNREEGRNRPLLEAFREIGWTDEDLVAMGERLEPFIRVEPRVPEGAWVIENVACYEEHRGKGLVNALLESALERGRVPGAGRGALSVAARVLRARLGALDVAHRGAS